MANIDNSIITGKCKGFARKTAERERERRAGFRLSVSLSTFSLKIFLKTRAFILNYYSRIIAYLPCKTTAMKQKINHALLLICFATLSFAIQAQPELKTPAKKFQTQTEVTLPVKDFGKVFHVPFAQDRPDSTREYKIVFEASQPIDSFAKLYEPLDHVARMYNLHIYGGVPKKNLDVVLVVAGFGIPAVMNNEAYKKKYGVDNPNLKVLEELKAAGVKIVGCAQAMLKNSIDPSEVNPIITPIFSRFTTVSTYQLKGYAYFKE